MLGVEGWACVYLGLCLITWKGKRRKKGYREKQIKDE